MEKAIDTVFRVVRLSEPLREDLRRAREAKEQTNVAFIANAVVGQLPKVVEALRSLGFATVKGPRRPARLPFSTEAGTLKILRTASQETGIPAIQLLTACLLAATQTAQRKRGRAAAGKGKRKSRKSEAAS